MAPRRGAIVFLLLASAATQQDGDEVHPSRDGATSLKLSEKFGLEIEGPFIEFALEQSETELRAAKLWRSPSGLRVTNVQAGKEVHSTHGVSSVVPRYHRMVVYDEETDQYRIVRAKTDFNVREEKIVETRIKLNITYDVPGQDRELTVRSEIAKDSNGFMSLVKFYVPGVNVAHQLSMEEEKKSSHKTISVVSANIWNFNHWKLRIPLLKKEFGKILPDIIGFQEVRSVKYPWSSSSLGMAEPSSSSSSSSSSTSSPETLLLGKHQVEDLRKMLPGFQFVFEPAMFFDQGNELHQEGLAIFSRYPILATDYLELTRDISDQADFHQRVVLHAVVASPIGDVHAFVTHLSLSLSARTRTLEEIAKYVKSFDGPKVLVGDFNAVLEQEDPLFIQRHGFKDCWRSLNPSEAGWTFSSWTPKSRIDYIFSQGLQPDNAHIWGTESWSIPKELVNPEEYAKFDGKFYPSDHMFLACEFIV
mmetsp:Transcript_9216/g.14966  ORF Transcript_9216/g.14966 Transcript_9216/m.14966 type:complete len:476 (-) Transcript_9216:145-1572(-)